MERQEKIRRLAERMNVTEAEAAKALDEAGGDLLDAALLLEHERPVQARTVHTHSTAAAQQLPAAGAPTETAKENRETGDKVTEAVIDVLTGLVTHPILNAVEIEYKGKRLATIPAVILLTLFLVRYWIVLGLAAVGLMVGWNISFTGPQWSNATLNAAWKRLEDTAAGWREKMKHDRPHG